MILKQLVRVYRPNDAVLTDLSIRGVLGFATRCVRRALPQYQSPRRTDQAVLEKAVRSAERFVSGNTYKFRGKALKYAVLRSKGSEAESVAVAVTHLTWATTVARSLKTKQLYRRHVLVAADLAIVSAHDSCFFDQFVDASNLDYQAIRHACGAETYPAIGQTFDVTESGPLGPVWPRSFTRFRTLTRLKTDTRFADDH